MLSKRSFLLLLHPAFIFSVLLLLVNDFYLKAEYHNGLTGKLSDFAGLFAFTVFLIAFFPKRRKSILVFSALFFCWWKSPFSSGFIFFLNDRLHLPAGRIIDYTDLFALPVLPFILLLKTPVYRFSLPRRVTVCCISFISFFAFCSTSMVRGLYYSPYGDEEIYFGEIYFTSLPEKEVLARLTAGKNNYRADSVKQYPALRGDSLFYRIKKGSDTTWAYVPNNNDSLIFVKRPVSPFYSIPQVIIGGDTLYRLEVRINSSRRKKKHTRVIIESFRLQNFPYKGYYEPVPHQKDYKKYFRELFK